MHPKRISLILNAKSLDNPQTTASFLLDNLDITVCFKRKHTKCCNSSIATALLVCIDTLKLRCTTPRLQPSPPQRLVGLSLRAVNFRCSNNPPLGMFQSISRFQWRLTLMHCVNCSGLYDMNQLWVTRS